MSSIIDLNGKNILITGAASGIGRACSRLFANQGANVILVDLVEDGLAETADGLDARQVLTLPTDLTCMENLPVIVEQGKSRFGLLSGIVHCAGVSSRKPLRVLKSTGFSKVMGVNFYSFVDLVRIATRKEYFNDGGSVVVMSSISSVRGYKAKSEYCVSKAAVDAFVRCAALEVADRGIRVNSVMPGEVLTPMAIRAREINNSVGAPNFSAPLGSSQPEEIANTIAFLLSDATKTITGTSIVIDGGATI